MLPRCRSAVLLTFATTLAACGGPSAEDYRADAGAICRDAAKETEAIAAPTKATAPAIADYFERLVGVTDRATERFGELDPPQDLEKAHEEVVEANQSAGEEVREVIAALERGQDAEAVLGTAQQRIEEATTRASEAAERLNVPDCSR